MTTVERMKASMDAERRVIESHLRILHDELGYERRRSLAQLIIILIIIGVGVATKSETIDELLKSLAEVRRQGVPREPHSRHQKRLSTGPLAGLVIDVPSPSSSRDHSRTASPAITPTVNASQQTAQRLAQRSRGTPSLSRSSSLRRAENVSGSSSQHHRRRLATRSVTIADTSTFGSGFGFADDEDSPSVSVPQGFTPTQGNRSRLSLHPRTAGGSSRRLARSSHLHTMRSRRAGDESSDADIGDGASPHSINSLATPSPINGGHGLRGNSPVPRIARTPRNDDHDDSQWGTEDGLSAADVASTSGGASASEVDDETGGIGRQQSPLAHRVSNSNGAGPLSALGFHNEEAPPEYNNNHNTNTSETQPIAIRVLEDAKHNDTLHAHSL